MTAHRNQYAERDEVVRVLRKLTKEQLVALVIEQRPVSLKSDLHHIERLHVLWELDRLTEREQALHFQHMDHMRQRNFDLARTTWAELRKCWERDKVLHRRFLELTS